MAKRLYRLAPLQLRLEMNCWRSVWRCTRQRLDLSTAPPMPLRRRICPYTPSTGGRVASLLIAALVVEGPTDEN
jgi:hypothetical protein